MTTTSSRMYRRSIASTFLIAVTCLGILSSCTKDNLPVNQSNQVSTYSSEVLDKWMTMQLRLMRNATGIQNQAFSRHFVYAGIAALQSVAPGLPAHDKWTERLNGLTGLPAPDHSVNYYYPANVNAAMAYINKSMFPNASAADKSAIDSLENALTGEFLSTEQATRVNASALFGKSVAIAVYNWAQTDGYQNANNPYTAPTGPGMWVPTSPGSTAASPYWGNNRTVIIGSINNTQPAAPTAYSTDPNSAFYQMAKKVYDASQTLTNEQKAMAIFWRDVPGVSSPGHWVSILQQAIRQTNSRLDKAAFAYALTGAAVNDALISAWKTKYQYNLVRPVTYIRDVMGHSGWTPFLGTPPHPEYTSAHSVLSVAAGVVMDRIFGKIDSFTDHTYDYLGFAPRTYPSFEAVGEEAGNSRLFAGIHYQPSIDIGIIQGKKVAENILNIPPAGQ